MLKSHESDYGDTAKHFIRLQQILFIVAIA